MYLSYKSDSLCIKIELIRSIIWCAQVKFKSILQDPIICLQGNKVDNVQNNKMRSIETPIIAILIENINQSGYYYQIVHIFQIK